MWRNSIRFSSKLLISHKSYLPSSSSISSAAGKSVVQPLLLLSHSHSHPRCSSSSSPSESLKLGFPRSDGIQTVSATAVDVSSFAGSKAMDLARHYGRCYWELSKARLRYTVLKFSLSLLIFSIEE